jgi:hypothetical protein
MSNGRVPLLRINPAAPLSALWLAVSLICWFSAAPFVGEPPELTAIAFANGGCAAAIGDGILRSRSTEAFGTARLFSIESGGSKHGIPVWIAGLVSAVIGIAYAIGLLR